MISMENVSKQRKEDQKFEFPIGFRFNPTDEELINHYLANKVADSNFNAIAIAEVNMNKCEPWDLPWLAKIGEEEWYFYCVRDKKYPAGPRANRATEAGFWKATGNDKEITKKKSLIGMKKTLVFYKGRAPKGEKTNWVMHEYRLEGNIKKSEWVVCRVFERSQNRKITKIQTLTRDFPPNNSETSTTVGQVTSFYDPNETENHKMQGDNNVFSKETSVLNSSSRPFGVKPIANDTPLVSNQTLQIGNSEYSGCFLPRDQSMLLENNESSAKQFQNADFTMGDFGDDDISSLIYNNDMFQMLFDNQELSSAFAEPLDIDCLWN